MSRNVRTIARLGAVLVAASLLWACEGDDGAQGPQGPAGPQGDQGLPGPPGPSGDTGIVIGDGAELTAEEIETLGKLEATITGVTVSSPPVVDFTVFDQNGNPALGIAEGVVWMTFAKLVPPDPDVNGGLAYWQNYVNRARTSDLPGSIPNAVQATNDNSGTLEELGDGQYRYTFATDVTNVTDPIAVPWEPSLTHRVGLEIRLDGPGETPLAPFNPTFDFVPDGGAGSGVTKAIADLDNCADCHNEFSMHGGPRKSVDYCVTCHNPGTVDPDSGESVDMAYLAHSIHMGHDRATPYIIYGFGGREHNFGEVHFPQSQTYCETCHVESETHPDGNNWNTQASAKACGGCHADGLLASDFDPVTGQAVYQFDHSVADLNLGAIDDGECASCHLGSIGSAGPALKIHSTIDGDQRFREELGKNFVFEILDATNTAPGETPVITFRVTDAAGTPYDILTAPEFDTANGASLNLYVAWTTDDIYNGERNGATGSLRYTDRSDPADGIPDVVDYSTAHPHRMYLDALQFEIAANPGWVNADGSYTVTYFTSLPTDIMGDVMISLGGHPAAVDVEDADGIVGNQRAAARSVVFFPGEERQVAVESDKCNACHQQLQFHGSNRNGEVKMCLNCHNADQSGSRTDDEGFAMSRMIHSIHAGSASFSDGYTDVHFPQSIANCDACHVDGAYNTARESARSISIAAGASNTSWLDDAATTPTAQACGNCHTSVAAMGHFNTQGAQLGVAKDEILTVGGLPNGQEACAVCHGTGAEFETAQYHNPGVE